MWRLVLSLCFCAVFCGCELSKARDLRGPLAGDAMHMHQLASEWECDTSWIALTQGLSPPYINCMSRANDTVFEIVRDTAGLVVSTVRELRWDSILGPSPAQQMITSIESRFGDGSTWCDASEFPYRQLWQLRDMYVVLVVDSGRGIANLAMTLGHPLCTPTKGGHLQSSLPP
jgi:hypothetical protein